MFSDQTPYLDHFRLLSLVMVLSLTATIIVPGVSNLVAAEDLVELNEKASEEDCEKNNTQFHTDLEPIATEDFKCKHRFELRSSFRNQAFATDVPNPPPELI